MVILKEEDMSKSINIIYHYSLDHLKICTAIAFDDEKFPIQLKTAEKSYQSKTELVADLSAELRKMDYNKVYLLSNEAFNTALDSKNVRENLIHLFKEYGEKISLESPNESSFLSRIFGRD